MEECLVWSISGQSAWESERRWCLLKDYDDGLKDHQTTSPPSLYLSTGERVRVLLQEFHSEGEANRRRFWWWNSELPSTLQFTGTEKEIAKILSKLRADDNPTCIAINGCVQWSSTCNFCKLVPIYKICENLQTTY